MLWKDQTPSPLPCPWPVLTHKAGKQATGVPWVEIYGQSLSLLPASTRHNTLLSPTSCFGHEPMPKFHPSKHVRLCKLDFVSWSFLLKLTIPDTPLTFGASFEESFLFSFSEEQSASMPNLSMCFIYLLTFEYFLLETLGFGNGLLMEVHIQQYKSAGAPQLWCYSSALCSTRVLLHCFAAVP